MAAPRIFISHSHVDDKWCRCFLQSLRDAGYDIWYDAKSLRGGDRWMEVIEKELQERTVFIVILTPDALQSPWVRREIQLALSKQRTIICVQHKVTQVTGFLSLEANIIDVVGLDCTSAAKQVAIDLRRRYGTVELSASTPLLPDLKAAADMNRKRSKRPSVRFVLTFLIIFFLLSSTLLFVVGRLNGVKPLSKVEATIYGVIGDGSIAAINAADGKPRWSVLPPNGDSWFPSATLNNGVIYATSLKHTLYAIQTNQGKSLWSYPLGDTTLGTIAVSTDAVYIVLNHSVDALNVKDGTLLRRYQVGNDNSFIPSALTIADGILFITTFDYVPDPLPGQCQQPISCSGTTGSGGAIYAFKINDGSLLWHRHTSARGYATPTVVRGIVYVADGVSINALQESSGYELWHSPSILPIQHLTVSDGLICCSEGRDSSGYFLSAIATSTGNILWKYPIPGVLFPSLTLLEGVIYLCECENAAFKGQWGLRALQAVSGKVLWFFPRNRISFGYVHVVHDGVAYFSSHDDGDVHDFIDALHIKDGTLAWSRKTLGLADPVLAGEMLYTGIGNSISDPSLYAIQATNGSLAWRYQARANVYQILVGP